MDLHDEDRAVRALLAYDARLQMYEGDERRAIDAGLIDPEDVDGLVLAADDGLTPDDLVPFRSLARSRGLTLEQVLRSRLRGELRDVVELPKARA